MGLETEKKILHLVFVGGRGAPSGYVVGQVYALPRRYRSFAWFVDAPEGRGEGDMVDLLEVRPVGSTPSRDNVRMVDTSIPLTVDHTKPIKLVFVGGVGAPSGYTVGQVVELPLRYARFPWWQLLEKLDAPKAGAPVEAAKVVKAPKVNADLNRAFAEHMGMEILDEGEETVAPSEVEEPAVRAPIIMEKSEDSDPGEANLGSMEEQEGTDVKLLTDGSMKPDKAAIEKLTKTDLVAYIEGLNGVCSIAWRKDELVAKALELTEQALSKQG
jgi:hypothetical protein